MPLHADNEVSGGVKLDSFNDAVDRGDRSHEQIVAGSPDGLMMARVHLGHGPLGGGNQPGESRSGSDACWMGIGDAAARAMVHCGFEVLNERTVAPDVERLGAMAYGKNGLLQIEGILKQKLINGGAGWVCLAAFWDRIFAKSLWVHIEATAGQQDSLNAAKQPGDAIGPFMQRNNDGGDAGQMCIRDSCGERDKAVESDRGRKRRMEGKRLWGKRLRLGGGRAGNGR